MRNFRHWTPSYLASRYRRHVYERRHPDVPWITAAAVSLLETILLPTDVGLELGSGRSTRWFAARLKRLVSVENDPPWYEQVKGELERHAVTNVSYTLQSHVHPDPAQSPYVRFVREQPDRSFNFVLVDGAYRIECVHAVLPKITPGGVLVIDNIHWFLDHPTKSPYSRFGKGPSTEPWREFETRVRGWRKMWTSDGTNDTAFWIAPPTLEGATP